MFVNFLMMSSISVSGIWFGPSERALAGFECVSMKTPSTPVATAARARTGARNPSPPVDPPSPPGRWTEWVASKMTLMPSCFMM